MPRFSDVSTTTPTMPAVGTDALVAAMREVGSATSDATLRAWTAEPVGIGAMADTYRLLLEWGAPGSGPASVVAKLPSTDEAAARTAASIGAYEREVRFYRDLAPRTELSLPVNHGVLELDGAENGLLLEDLSHLADGDQFADAHPATLRAMREQLALLQAPFWEDPTVAGVDWLHRRLGVPIPGIVARMERSWAESRDRLAGDFDPEERAQIDRFVRGAGAWAESLTGPFTLTHHDYRLDNIRLDPQHPGRIVVLDWQTVGWGTPMFDVAYLLGTSVEPEKRREIERAEIARHVDDLAWRGVQWDHDEAWVSYRQNSFATLLMLVPPTGSVKRSERGDAMYRRLLRFGARMALDLEADEFLRDPN